MADRLLLKEIEGSSSVICKLSLRLLSMTLALYFINSLHCLRCKWRLRPQSLTSTLIGKYGSKRLIFSVTRFGEISPLWQIFNNLGNIFKFYLVLGTVFNSVLYNLYAFGQISLLKMAKYWKKIWSSGHTAYIAGCQKVTKIFLSKTHLGVAKHSESSDQLHDERRRDVEGVLLHDPPGDVTAAQLHPDVTVLLPEHGSGTENQNGSDLCHIQKISQAVPVGKKELDRSVCQTLNADISFFFVLFFASKWCV